MISNKINPKPDKSIDQLLAQHKTDITDRPSTEPPTPVVEVAVEPKSEVAVEPKTPTDIASLIKGQPTTSAKIRALKAAGMSTGTIAKALNKRYQHVRNVLITPVKTPRA
jgi:hypothetical protein